MKFHLQWLCTKPNFYIEKNTEKMCKKQAVFKKRKVGESYNISNLYTTSQENQ